MRILDDRAAVEVRKVDVALRIDAHPVRLVEASELSHLIAGPIVVDVHVVGASVGDIEQQRFLLLVRARNAVRRIHPRLAMVRMHRAAARSAPRLRAASPGSASPEASRRRRRAGRTPQGPPPRGPGPRKTRVLSCRFLPTSSRLARPAPRRYPGLYGAARLAGT